MTTAWSGLLKCLVCMQGHWAARLVLGVLACCWHVSLLSGCGYAMPLPSLTNVFGSSHSNDKISFLVGLRCSLDVLCYFCLARIICLWGLARIIFVHEVLYIVVDVSIGRAMDKSYRAHERERERAKSWNQSNCCGIKKSCRCINHTLKLMLIFVIFFCFWTMGCRVTRWFVNGSTYVFCFFILISFIGYTFYKVLRIY